MKKILAGIATIIMSLGVLIIPAATPATAFPQTSVMNSMRMTELPCTIIARGYERRVAVWGHWDGVWNSGVYGSIFAAGEVLVGDSGGCGGPRVATWVEMRAVPSFQRFDGVRFLYNSWCAPAGNVGAGGAGSLWRVNIDCRPPVQWENQGVYNSLWHKGFHWMTIQVWLPVEQASFVVDSPVWSVW